VNTRCAIMCAMEAPVEVYLEVGAKRVFAGAQRWPGWCRSGRDEPSALQALLDHGPRYAAALGRVAPDFRAPADPAGLDVVERLPGDATTDFGAPGAIPAQDAKKLSIAELERRIAILTTCWEAFDATARSAGSLPLRSGPRGGGRDVARMRAHVLDADRGYLAQLGGKFRSGGQPPEETVRLVRQAFLEALRGRMRGELPDVGPKGGARWPPAFAVRRSAWHALDHAWEIQDRLEPAPAAG
jgi:hypothetical protein